MFLIVIFLTVLSLYEIQDRNVLTIMEINWSYISGCKMQVIIDNILAIIQLLSTNEL